MPVITEERIREIIREEIARLEAKLAAGLEAAMARKVPRILNDLKARQL